MVSGRGDWCTWLARAASCEIRMMSAVARFEVWKSSWPAWISSAAWLACTPMLKTILRDVAAHAERLVVVLVEDHHDLPAGW